MDYVNSHSLRETPGLEEGTVVGLVKDNSSCVL